jgi:hypothetical protein
MHSKELRLLKYFLNKAKTREHIISADWDGIVCIWSAPNAYFNLQKKYMLIIKMIFIVVFYYLKMK